MIENNHINQSENSVQSLGEMSNTDYLDKLIKNNDLIAEINEIEVERNYDVHVSKDYNFTSTKSKFAIDLSNEDVIVNELTNDFDENDDHYQALEDVYQEIDQYDLEFEGYEDNVCVNTTDFSIISEYDKKSFIDIWIELELKYNKKYLLTDFMMFNDRSEKFEMKKVLLNRDYVKRISSDNTTSIDQFIENYKSQRN